MRELSSENPYPAGDLSEGENHVPVGGGKKENEESLLKSSLQKK